MQISLRSGLISAEVSGAEVFDGAVHGEVHIMIDFGDGDGYHIAVTKNELDIVMSALSEYYKV